MKIHFGHIIFMFLLGCGVHLSAQTNGPLTLSNCLNRAFDANSQLKTMANLLAIEQQNRKVIVTSLIPQVNLNIGINEAVQNSQLSFIDDIIPPSEITGARTYGQSGSVGSSLDFTDFANALLRVKGAHYSTEALKYENKVRENEVILSVIKTYMDCLLSQETVNIIKFRAETSAQIAAISTHQLAVGLVDSATYYQTLINAEKDRIAWVNATIEMEKTRRLLGEMIDLNVNEVQLDTLLFITATQPIHADSAVSNPTQLGLQGLENRLLEREMQQKAMTIAMLPHVGVFANYGFSNQTFQNGIVSESRVVGPSYGLNIGYELGTVKNALHQRKIARLQAENLQTEWQREKVAGNNELWQMEQDIEQLKMNVDSDLMLEQMTFLTLKTAITGFQLGTKTINELRQIQDEYANTLFTGKKRKLDLLLAHYQKMALQIDLKGHFLGLD